MFSTLAGISGFSVPGDHVPKCLFQVADSKFNIYIQILYSVSNVYLQTGLEWVD